MGGHTFLLFTLGSGAFPSFVSVPTHTPLQCPSLQGHIESTYFATDLILDKSYTDVTSYVIGIVLWFICQ